jgi:hypothetical protein
MKRNLSIIIFGNSEDIELISLKCFLVKYGIGSFISKKPSELNSYDLSAAKNNALFVVSRNLNPKEVESIFTQARQFSVPVLQL